MLLPIALPGGVPLVVSRWSPRSYPFVLLAGLALASAPAAQRPVPESSVPSVIAAALVTALLGLGGVLALRARLARRTRALERSEPRFRVVAESLPALVEPVRELAPARSGAGMVLVVDDDERVLSVACALIANRGWTVERASCAEDALHKARTVAPDVVLLDLTMPDMNGLELMGRLRAAHPELPVVLMSGYSERETALGAVPADGFVQKPFTGDQLFEVLRRVRAPSPAARP